jgi:hypothetical protein
MACLFIPTVSHSNHSNWLSLCSFPLKVLVTFNISLFSVLFFWVYYSRYYMESLYRVISLCIVTVSTALKLFSRMLFLFNVSRTSFIFPLETAIISISVVGCSSRCQSMMWFVCRRFLTCYYYYCYYLLPKTVCYSGENCWADHDEILRDYSGGHSVQLFCFKLTKF